jgi:hypothetical protein
MLSTWLERSQPTILHMDSKPPSPPALPTTFERRQMEGACSQMHEFADEIIQNNMGIQRLCLSKPFHVSRIGAGFRRSSCLGQTLADVRLFFEQVDFAWAAYPVDSGSCNGSGLHLRGGQLLLRGSCCTRAAR